MKNKRVISMLVVGIIILAAFACIVGIFLPGGPGEHEITSFRGDTIKIYGIGLYQEDSLSTATQGIVQDYVTLFLGIPLLILALFMTRKESLKSRLLLTGTLGYYLYTYISYVFLWMYNPLFIVYVMLMSASFFAFILSLLSIDTKHIKEAFNEKLPVKFLGGFQIFFAVALGLLWLSKIGQSLVNGATPVGLDHYTTLVIQGLDLGFIVPIAFLSGVLLIKREKLGYLLSSVIIIKGFTMGTCLSAMIIGQLIAGVSMGIVEVILFPLISLFIFICLIVLLKNCKE